MDRCSKHRRVRVGGELSDRDYRGQRPANSNNLDNGRGVGFDGTESDVASHFDKALLVFETPQNRLA